MMEVANLTGIAVFEDLSVVATERTRLAKMMIWDLNELLGANEKLAGRIQEIANSRD